jgi:hypothetical protein
LISWRIKDLSFETDPGNEDTTSLTWSFGALSNFIAIEKFKGR